MKRIKISEISDFAALRRDRSIDRARIEQVSDILSSVKASGDAAVRKLSLKFDRIAPTRVDIAKDISIEDYALLKALKVASDNITAYHRPQLRSDYTVDRGKGLLLQRLVRPISRVGFYIPGGSAPLISTLMMLIIPARLAGCTDFVLCTPPTAKGIDPSLRLAARYFGIDTIFAIGGAQAIAAMAYGTESVPKVDKIFGPGNVWVNEAKRQVSIDPDGAAIDLPAGPSEIMVVAEKGAHARSVASDLLSQAEHDPEAQIMLLSLDEDLTKNVLIELDNLLPTLSRQLIARSALERAFIVEGKDRAEALKVINAYAPEHLILQVESPNCWLPEVRNAGSIFCGPFSPEAAGDFASGTNHVLPTGGAARAYSGLQVESFQKTISVQTLSKAALEDLAPTLFTFAEREGLDAHALAVKVRMEDLASYPVITAPPSAYLRPSILRMKGYSSAAREGSTALIKLDANESPWSYDDDGYNLYPPAQSKALLGRIAELNGVPEASLLMTRGIDEAIDLMIRSFCEPISDSILIQPPTYGYYQVAAEAHGCMVERVPLTDDFSIDLPALRQKSAKLAFICNPNNPTGNLFNRSTILDIAERFDGIVVVDEAYIEFCEAESVLDQVARFPNLVVMRTFSKAWASAGLRVGWIAAHPSVIEVLNKVVAPYPISQPSLKALNTRLSQGGVDAMRLGVKHNEGLKREMMNQLKAIRGILKIYPSAANFLLVKVRDPSGLCLELRRQGISIRDRSGDVPGTVRITVGDNAANDKLLRALRTILS
jgi:histidinol-phosphate aminotransferase